MLYNCLFQAVLKSLSPTYEQVCCPGDVVAIDNVKDRKGFNFVQIVVSVKYIPPRLLQTPNSFKIWVIGNACHAFPSPYKFL